MNKQITKSQILDARDKLIIVQSVVKYPVMQKYLNLIIALLDDLRLNEARPE